ncbi:MAG: hypothetical protein EOO38_17450 [Cytophagaceae bacterium]|nr:MAG: hypothetical protein EOO38_17450 [Cytophagaceae bacterium]
MDTNVLCVQDSVACIFFQKVEWLTGHLLIPSAYEGIGRIVELLVMTLGNRWLPASFFRLAKAAALLIEISQSLD